MLLIAHGVPKSASTHIFSMLSALAAGDAEEPFAARAARLMPAPFDSLYQRHIARPLVMAAQDCWPPEHLLVYKTHARLDPFIHRQLETGRVAAVSSFRDPRDVALALIDAGKQADRTGHDFFAQFRTLDDTIPALDRMVRKSNAWLDAPEVLPMPFDLVAGDPDAAYRRLAEYADTPGAQRALASPPPARERVKTFNKGRIGRHKDEMTAADSERFLDRYSAYIERCVTLTRRVMAETAEAGAGR